MLPSLMAVQLRLAITEFLSTTYAIGDEHTREALARFLTDQRTGIFRGPYLHVRVPYRQVDEFWQHPLEWAPEDLRPFQHQATAWERLSSLNHTPQPTLVRTGTGSGKTESFLVPILDHCQRARAEGQRGIKALLLYPMNALASDQAGRIAKFIESEAMLRGVRAGIYVGGAKEDGEHVRVQGGHLIDSRAEMRAEPPDILLTNYKMLDYLLLRDTDRELWAENTPDTLRYLVLDELHSYDGAQGTDVAMLIRRLGARLNMHDEQGALGGCCPVATSATLGSGETATASLADFATKLFGTQVTVDAIVSDDRLTATEATDETEFDFPVPEPSAVVAIARNGDQPAHDYRETMSALFFDHPLVPRAAELDSDGKPSRPAEPDLPPIELLGHRLRRHHLTRALLEAASDRPRDFDDVINRLAVRTPSWGRAFRRDPDEVRAALAEFLALLSMARVNHGGRLDPLYTVQVQLSGTRGEPP